MAEPSRVAQVHKMHSGRWYAAVQEHQGCVILDMQAGDNRVEVEAWLTEHYPDARVIPCDCPRDEAGHA